MTRTLVLIALFLALIIGSFIWFVATWDPKAEESLSLILPQISPPEAPTLTTKSPISDPYAFHTHSIRIPYGVS